MRAQGRVYPTIVLVFSQHAMRLLASLIAVFVLVLVFVLVYKKQEKRK